MLELGLAAALEGELAGHPLGGQVWDTLRRMTDALAAVVDVRLRPPRQGDGDDGHGLLLDGPGYDRWASLLATGAALFGPAPWWPAVPGERRTHRAVDAARRPAAPRRAPGRRAGRRCSPTPAWRSCATPTAGPTSCGAVPTTARTATCRSPPTPTPTPCAIEVRVGGVDVLADPGTYCYGADPAWRACFRSTLAHNTLEVGGVDQSVAAGPHLWTRQARSELEQATGLDGGPVAEWRAAHDGYRRLRPPAVHRRSVRLDRPARRLVVEDRLDTGGAHDCRLAFHLGPDVACTLERGRAVLEWRDDHGRRGATLSPPRRARLAAPGRPDGPAGRLVLAGVRRSRAHGHAGRERPGRRRPGVDHRPTARPGERTMRISVFGLGYVGAVSAACLAADGHTVVGVDTNPVKVDLLNQGRAPVVEAGLGELIEEGVRAGRLRATTDCDAAVAGTDIAFVCVGTPSSGNGSLDLTYLRRVAGDIGQAIRRRRSPITVVVRSTVLPGTTRQVLLPDAGAAPRAGRWRSRVYPEFLREGTAIRDYREPPKVVVGALDERGPRPGHPAGGAAGCTAGPDRPGAGRDGQVRRQRLARPQGRLRQRDRQPGQGPGARRPAASWTSSAPTPS